MNLLVREPVLIPRPETEEWTLRFLATLKAANLLDRHSRVLDLCSGSGCIGLAIAQAAPSFEIVGLDVSPVAVELAQRNALRHEITNAKFYQVDLFDDMAMSALKLGGSFDYIVSNPPYIPEDQYLVLERSVKDYEDPLALIGTYPLNRDSLTQNLGDGMAFYRRISIISKTLLSQNLKSQDSSRIPRIVLEIGQGQADGVSAIFNRLSTETWRDFAGIERNVVVVS